MHNFVERQQEHQEKAIRIADRIINGLVIKYDPEIHIPLLLNLFLEGKDISAFIYAAEVCEATFHNWVNKHKEFRIAYEMARFLARMHWEEMGYVGLSDPSFNTKLWSMVMRNRFGLTEHRKLRIPGLKTAKDFQGQIRCILDHLSEGNLTGSEAMQLSNLVLAAVKVREHTDTEKRLEAVEESLEGRK